MTTKKAGTILLNLETKQIGLVYRSKDKGYTFPKGHLEGNETLQQCAIRETEEETLRACHLLYAQEISILKYTTPNGEKVENHMYLAIDDGLTSKNIPFYDREKFEWFSFDDIETKLNFNNLKKLWNEVKEQVYKILYNYGEKNVKNI